MDSKKVTFLNPQGQQEVRDIFSPEQVTGFVKSGFKVVDNPWDTSTTDTTIPGVSDQNPISSTQGIRDKQTIVKSDASDLYNNLNTFDSAMNAEYKRIIDAAPYSETEAGKAAMAELETLRKNLGIISPAEQQQIDQAGSSAGAKFDPLINDALEQKRQGQAKSLVAGGERGGFMNTQISGTAALTPVNSGTFIGAGGELERIQSVYDNNISQLKSQKEMAIQLARDAASKAIRTGKIEDMAAANEAFDRATKAHNDAIALANEKVSAISNYKKLVQNQRDNLLTEIQKYTSIGSTIPDSLKATVDDTYGVGFSDKYASVLKAQQKGKVDMETATKLVDILSKIPEDQEFKIGDTTYTGLKQVDPKRGLWVTTETDRSGNVTQVTTRMNPDTGKMEIVSTLELGNIGKGSGGGGDGNNNDEDYKYAIDIIGSFPDATDEDLKVQLMQETKLSTAEINALIDNRDSYKIEAPKSSGSTGAW